MFVPSHRKMKLNFGIILHYFLMIAIEFSMNKVVD